MKPALWIPHALLLAAIVLGAGGVRARHVPTDTYATRLESGTPDERLRALLVLTRRDDPVRLGPRGVRRLLNQTDPRLREIAMTPEVSHAARKAKQTWLQGVEDEAERVRCEQWLRPPTDGARTYRHPDLVRYLEACDE